MDLTRLSAMLQNSGPFATALIDVSRVTEDAAHQIELRMRAAGATLADQGAPTEVVDLIGDHMLDPTGVSGHVQRFLVATADGMIADEVLPQWQHADEVTWGPLPDVTSWLAHLEATVPVLVVVADRVGAELRYYDAWRHEPALDSVVDGQSLHISKIPDGGWSMAGLQHRTEEVWRRNANDVAAEIARLSAPGLLVVLAGDERARHEIVNAWDPRPDQRVVHATHGARSNRNSAETLEADVTDAVRRTVIGFQLARIRELGERKGRRDQIALGVRQTMDAFVEGQVGTLFLHAPAASARSVRVADHLGWSLPANVPDDAELRGDLAVLAAAATTSADAVFVGASSVPDDGVAALLRWDAP